ncbi:MAG TPA: VOC family protein [Ktedonobacterales bacterium]|jgi:catechol 2,3-dioxygenase-like lactoylglutathione lyase family enzyme
MIGRFDHAVIAVRDLAEAIRRYQALGFAVSPGGRHTGRGTENAIIRFGLDYLELIAIYDEAELAGRGLNGQALGDFLSKQEGGLVGYALATAGIARDAERFQQTGLTAEGPFAMERLRPDGRRLSWRLLVPESVPWRRPWPFLIQWDAPDAERLAWEAPGVHPNGATGVAGISLVVHNLEQAIDLYQRQLGLTLKGQDKVSHRGVRRALFAVGSLKLILLEPDGAGPVQETLEAVGEGPFELIVACKSLDQTRVALAQAGLSVEQSDDTAGVLLPLREALGARLRLHDPLSGQWDVGVIELHF